MKNLTKKLVAEKEFVFTNILYVLYLLYFLPASMTEVWNILHIFVLIIESLGCLFCFAYLIIRIKQVSKPLLYLSAVIALSAIVTLFSGFSIANYVRWFAIYKDIFAIAVLTEILYNENPARYRRLAENVLTAGLILNVASVVCFPGGMLKVPNEVGVKHPHFFYDYDNHFPTRYIPTFAIIYLNDQSRKFKRLVPAMFLGLLSFLVTGSVMCTVAMSAMILGYFLAKYIPAKILNIRNVWFLYIVLSCVVVAISHTDAFGALADSVGKDVSLLSRTRMWKISIPTILEKPIFGTGVLNTVTMRSLFRYATLHNALLNTLLWGGVAGLAVYTLFICSVSNRLTKNATDNTVKVFAILFGGMMILCLMDCIEILAHIYAFFILAANYKEQLSDGATPVQQK